MKRLLPTFALCCLTIALAWRSFAVEPVPDKLVVLRSTTVASQANFVAPLLKEHGFGATFFITEGFELAIRN